MTKIISYNVNGLRAAIKKDWLGWLKATDADVVCLQEIKATPDQLELAPLMDMGYHLYWHPAQKKGYSGVAIFTKKKPDNVVVGCGEQLYDDEGRVLRVDFGENSFYSVYMPSGSSGDHRQSFKMEWLEFWQDFVNRVKTDRPNMVVSGDYNICHKAIDIHNPVSNKNSSGFLPEEREWLGNFIDSGFVDSFRHFHEEPHQYTWWTYRFGARGKNLGWRIDYHMVSKPLEDKLMRAEILSDAVHSDHCPILVELDL